MCPLCPCSCTTAQYGGGGACVPYVHVVVRQHSMEEEEEHVRTNLETTSDNSYHPLRPIGHHRTRGAVG